MNKKDQDQRPTIVFDLGGVLLDWNPRYLYNKMFAGDETKVDYFLSVVCPNDWNVKQDEGRPFREAIAERVALFPEYEPYIQAYWSRWEEMIGGQIIGTLEILADLKDAGYHLCALSNWSAETYPRVYKHFEFLSWFDVVVLSGEEKVAKPDARIYEILLHRINREAQQCLFIDDSEPNIVAANNLGFQTIHFVFPEDLKTELVTRNLLSP